MRSNKDDEDDEDDEDEDDDDDDEEEDEEEKEEELCILAGEGGVGEQAAAGRRGQDMVSTLPAAHYTLHFVFHI